MNQATAAAYDSAPYDSLAYPQSQPDRLATQATLFHLAPAAVDCCRVLELGCASGGNLLPQAVNFPRSQYVGIDLSARQIADGIHDAQALGLNNIEFRQMSITDVDTGLGNFDYIIAHGVYSWVSAEVREKLIESCKRNLSPNGVAYLSYNVYPGWHIHGMIRDMMCYHADRVAEPEMKAEQARRLLDFLAAAVLSQDNAYSIMLNQELSKLAQMPDFYLLHDHLEEVNAPLYFHEFAQHARKHGLQYLGEAQFHLMAPPDFVNEVRTRLNELTLDIIRVEQYMDFVRNRRFRQSLLVHDNLVVNRQLAWEELRTFRIASDAKPVSIQPDLHSTAIEEFRSPSDAFIDAKQPVTKTMMLILSEIWPKSLPFDELCRFAHARLNAPEVPDAATMANHERALGSALLGAYARGVVEFRTVEPHFVTEISDRPRAYTISLLQATRGINVANALHAQVSLGPLRRFILRQLDGSRSRGDIEASLAKAIRRREYALNQQGTPLATEDAVRAVPQVVQECLRLFSSSALLVA